MSPQKARVRVLESDNGHLDNDDSYRSCPIFIWLEDGPRAPEWWVDQNTSGKTFINGKYVVKCPGSKCMERRVPRDGNKACTNGALCNECCNTYQQGGFLPCCAYASHNYKIKIKNVSAPNENVKFTHKHKSRAEENGEMSNANPFFPEVATRINSISPYHASGGSKFATAGGNSPTTKEKTTPFQLAWHAKVC